MAQNLQHSSSEMSLPTLETTTTQTQVGRLGFYLIIGFIHFTTISCDNFSVSFLGYFTAPVRGVYYFRFTGHMAYSEKNMRMRLIKNSNAMVFIGDCKTPSTDPEDNASNGVVLQLEVGDVVSVQLSDSVWDDQYHRTTFSGFLLFPL